MPSRVPRYRPLPTPPKGTKSRGFSHCHRPASRYGWVYRLASGHRPIRFLPIREPFCWVHAALNEFGLVVYCCRNSRCLRRRFIGSGGWLDVSKGSEDSCVLVPLVAVIEDDDPLPPGRTPRPGNSIVRCPWCGHRMKPLDGDLHGTDPRKKAPRSTPGPFEPPETRNGRLDLRSQRGPKTNRPRR